MYIVHTIFASLHFIALKTKSENLFLKLEPLFFGFASLHYRMCREDLCQNYVARNKKSILRLEFQAFKYQIWSDCAFVISEITIEFS